MEKYRLVEEKIIGGNGFTNIEGLGTESGGDAMETEGGDNSSCTVRVTQQAKPRSCITNAMNILVSEIHIHDTYPWNDGYFQIHISYHISAFLSSI